MIASSNAGPVKRWVRAACLAVVLTAATPTFSRADEPTVPDHDARLDGYAQNMVLDAGGTATTYIVMCLIGGLGLGVLFISGKRSHLD